nr:phage integrase SAM-like domain-containing protein [Spirosoma liriopis]
MEQYIDQLSKEGRASTASSYKDSLVAIRTYHNRQSVLSFSAITPVWLKGFEQWMTGNSRSLTTVGIYLRSLRTIYNRAMEEGIPKKLKRSLSGGDSGQFGLTNIFLTSSSPA